MQRIGIVRSVGGKIAEPHCQTFKGQKVITGHCGSHHYAGAKPGEGDVFRLEGFPGDGTANTGLFRFQNGPGSIQQRGHQLCASLRLQAVVAQGNGGGAVTVAVVPLCHIHRQLLSGAGQCAGHMDAGLAVTAVILRQALIASRSTDLAFRPRLGVQIGTHIGDLGFANGCHIPAQIIGQVQCKGSLIDAGEGAVSGNGDFITANRYAVCGAGYLCRLGMQIIRIERKLHLAVLSAGQRGGRGIIEGHAHRALAGALRNHFHLRDANVGIIQIHCAVFVDAAGGGDGIARVGHAVSHMVPDGKGVAFIGQQFFRKGGGFPAAKLDR